MRLGGLGPPQMIRPKKPKSLPPLFKLFSALHALIMLRIILLRLMLSPTDGKLFISLVLN